MPSYNTGKFIKESIDCVLSQTYNNWELLIVDDCSTDNTDKVVESYKDPRIHYSKNEKNRGAAVSRNKALREAKGKWVAFLDSDDLWDSRKLEKMISFLENNNYHLAYHNYEKIDEESKPLNIYVTGPKVVTKRKFYHYDYPGCLTFVYDAKDYGLLQIEDIKKNNDYAMLLKLAKKYNCYLLNECLGKYRIRAHSISHDKLSKKLKSHYDLFRICDKRNPVSAFWFACWNMWFGILKKLRFEKKM